MECSTGSSRLKSRRRLNIAIQSKLGNCFSCDGSATPVGRPVRLDRLRLLPLWQEAARHRSLPVRPGADGHAVLHPERGAVGADWRGHHGRAVLRQVLERVIDL